MSRYKSSFCLLLAMGLSSNVYSTVLTQSEVEERSPDVHRIIENAPNPLGPVSILSFHHYALNRTPFDNGDVSFANNLTGLSLKSVHPLFSENLAGLVKDYYNNGEMPPGATSSVWQFLMNADGLPSSYKPTVEDDRMCIYTHRRYRLSDIANDAANALSNLGFVNSPDQWWFTVSAYNPETKKFDLNAPDYLLRDHPEAAPSKFSAMAINDGAIQTQSNERWCFKYDEPVIIRLQKGSRVASESDFEWIGNLAEISKVNLPSINGYPHFTGFADTIDLSDPFWSDNETQYVGLDILRRLFMGQNSSDFDLDAANAEIERGALEGTQAILGLLSNFNLPGDPAGQEEGLGLSDEIQEIVSDSSTSPREKLRSITSKSNKSLQRVVSNSTRDWASSHYKTLLAGDPELFDKLMDFKNSIKKNGLQNTINSLRFDNPIDSMKSMRPDQWIALGYNIWQQLENLSNPGNGTQEIVLAYIPGVSDGLTLFIDTSTKINNFHAFSRVNGVEVSDYNTSGFPSETITKHMIAKLTDISFKKEEACFYTDQHNLSRPAFCINAESAPQRPQSYLSFVDVPKGYWVKADFGSGRTPFYLTNSMDTIGNLSSMILPRGDVQLSLVKHDDIVKDNDYCLYYEELFSGVAQCYKGAIEFTSDRVQNDLGLIGAQSDTFNEQARVKSYEKLSDASLEMRFSGNKASLFMASLPNNAASFFGEDVSEIRAISDEQAMVYFDVNVDESIIIYEHPNYTGRHMTINSDVANLGFMDNLMSSWTLPKGWVVRFYEFPNFRGEYHSRIADGNANDFDDVTSSIRILEPAVKVTIFADTHYSGEYMDIVSDMSDLGPMNNKISSFLIPKGWEVRFYRQSNFEGNFYTRVDSQIATQFDNGIRSIQILKSNFEIFADRDYAGKHIGISSNVADLGVMDNMLSSWLLPTGWEVRFYEDRNFKGDYYSRVSSGNANIFEDRTSSIRILKPAPEFTIFDEFDYRGEFLNIDSDIAYLDKMGDRMSSWLIPEGWEVRFYEHPNYQGEYFTANSSSQFGNQFNDRISSVKILQRP